jgi:hypothetical protein
MRNAERRQLDEYLAEARRELFGQADPPFSTVDEAETWIRAESGRGAAKSGSARRQREFHARFDVISAEVRALANLAPKGLYLQFGLSRDLVSFNSAHEKTVCRVPATTDRLVRVAQVTRDAAAFADTSELSITMRLLIGAPLPTRRELTRTLSNPIGSRTLTSARTDPDVRKWNAFADRKRKLRDREFLRFMFSLEDRGATPPTAPGRQGRSAGVRQYWSDVLEQWNLKHQTSEWHFGHWTSVQRLYQRLTADLPERPMP